MTLSLVIFYVEDDIVGMSGAAAPPVLTTYKDRLLLHCRCMNQFVHKSEDWYPGRLDLDLDKPFISGMKHYVQKSTYDTAVLG